MPVNKRVEKARQERARKAKILAAVGLVVLLAIVGIQGPKTWKQLHPKKAAAPKAPTVQVAITATVTTGQLATAPAGSSSLVDTKVSSTPAAGQLASFTLFRAKDPFAQQISATAAESGTTTTSNPTPPTPPPAKPAAPTLQPVVVQMGKSKSPAADAAVAGGVVISLNGVPVRLTPGTLFPSGAPIFRLVSFKHGKARIGLVSGTFSNGAKTIVLTPGKTLVLQNTTGGGQYKLKLVSWT
jgi:hypothetical protein